MDKIIEARMSEYAIRTALGMPYVDEAYIEKSQIALMEDERDSILRSKQNGKQKAKEKI